MIRWSTPTLPVHVLNADLTHMAKVVVTFAQGCRRVSVEDPPMGYDADEDVTTLYPTLTQLQTAGFRAGSVVVQVNAIDAAGYRVPSDAATFHMGSNLLDEPMDGGDPTPGPIVPTGTVGLTANGTYDVARYEFAEVDVPGETTGVAVVTYDLNGAEGTPPAPEAFAIGGVTVDGVTYSNPPRLRWRYTATDTDVYWSGGGHAAIPPGKRFAEWNTNPDATGGYTEMPVAINEDTTVYAVWADA